MLLDDLRGYQFSFLSHRFEFVEKCCVIQHQLDQEEIKVRLGAKKTQFHILIHFYFVSMQIKFSIIFYIIFQDLQLDQVQTYLQRRNDSQNGLRHGCNHSEARGILARGMLAHDIRYLVLRHS